MNDIASKIQPRIDLQEPAFRKYEKFISRACFKTTAVDPKTCFLLAKGRPMNAYSFVTRFRDAVKAYRTYKYHSDLIPKDYPLENIKPLMLKDGSVLLSNTTADILIDGSGATAKRQGYYDISNIEAIIAICKKIQANEDGLAGYEVFKVSFDSAEQLTTLRQTIQPYSNVSGDLSDTEKNVFLIN